MLGLTVFDIDSNVQLNYHESFEYLSALSHVGIKQSWINDMIVLTSLMTMLQISTANEKVLTDLVFNL